MKESGRVVATIAVWAAVACSITLGVFRVNWSGAVGVAGAAVVSLGLAFAAGLGTFAIWRKAT